MRRVTSFEAYAPQRSTPVAPAPAVKVETQQSQKSELEVKHRNLVQKVGQTWRMSFLAW